MPTLLWCSRRCAGQRRQRQIGMTGDRGAPGGHWARANDKARFARAGRPIASRAYGVSRARAGGGRPTR